LRGIAAITVRSLSSAVLDPLEAWVASLDEAELRANAPDRAAQALLHNEVVDAALATGRTPVPARFGVYFPDDATCARILTDRREQLLQTLERVEGAVESSVLVVPRGPAPAKPRRPPRSEAGAGRRYLEAVREYSEAERRRRLIVEAEAIRVSEAVGEVVRAEQRSRDRRGVLSLAHLVSRDALEAYRALIAGVKISAEARILVGLVRAPYSFSALDGGETGHDSSSPKHDE
jgi:hypothetical protein